jgi:hypothetical protein
MFKRTQNTPRFQKGVALPDLIQRLARLGVVGIKGRWLLSTTGTNMAIISFPLNFGINDPPLPPLIRGVGGIEFVAGIFLIDITP